jgi:outer membrane protein
MRLSKHILTLLFLGAGIIANAQQTKLDTLSLQQCLDIAIKNNLQVKQGSTNAALAHVDLAQAKENLLPSISGNAHREFDQGRGINSVTNTYVNQSQTNDSYSLSGQLTIFNGLALENAVKSASLAYQAGKMDFQSAKDVVTVNVITGYLAILDDEEILSANISQQAVNQENVNLLAIRDKEGANTAASDLTDFQGQLASSKVAVVTSQNALDAAKLSLFQVMNIQYQPGTEFHAINAENLTGDYGVNPDQAYQTALNQFAAVKSAILRRESAEKTVKSSKGFLWPQLYLSGGLFTSYSSTAQKSSFVDSTTNAVPGLYVNGPNGKQSVFSTSANNNVSNISFGDQIKNNYGTYLQVGLNIPIFTNRLKYNTVTRAKINLLNYQNIEDNTKIQLKQSIETAFYNMTSAYKRYQVLKEQVAAYTESYRIYKLRFDAGVLTSYQFILAKNNLDAATVNMISARYDYFINSKILDYYQGKLTLE